MKKLFYGFLMVSCMALGQDVTFYSTQATWAATTTNDSWLLWNREKLLESISSSVRKGAPQSDIRALLGAPQSSLREAGDEIWTYGLYRQKFFHIVFDKNSLCTTTTTSVYRLISEKELSISTNIGVLSSDPKLDVGSWKSMIGLDSPAADRIQMAVGAARLLYPDMSIDKVEYLFGKPDSITTRQDQLVWTYQIGPGAFLQILYLDNKNLLGVYVRHYDRANGKLKLFPVCGVLEQPQDHLFDCACWRATFSRYIMNDERAGIGRRMALIIKPGMKREAVLSLLGEPLKIGTVHNKPYFSYLLNSDSSLKIYFKQDGIVDEVKAN